MQDLKLQIQEDMKQALKQREQTKLDVLRMALSEIKKRAIDQKRDLTLAESQKALQTMIKQRHEAAELYEKGGRPELQSKELKEIKILESYLPQPLTLEEVDALIAIGIVQTESASLKDLGKLMKWVTAEVQGRADGKQVHARIREKLEGLS